MYYHKTHHRLRDDHDFFEWPYQIDSEQFEKVLRYIKSGMASDAIMECGGARHGSKGFFIQPTVFSNVKVHLHCFVQLSSEFKTTNDSDTRLFESGQHVDCTGRDIWPGSVHLEVQVSYWLIFLSAIDI